MMAIFAVSMKHIPESCPMFNEEVKKKEAIVRRTEAAEKHGVKILSAYTSILDHLIFYVVEAPPQQSVESYFLEIGFAFWNTVEIRQAKLVEDMIKRVVGE